MAARGPYRIPLDTAPKLVTLPDTDYSDGNGYGFRCLDGDWTVGGPDMTAAAGATPGALIKAGEWLPLELGRTDEMYAAMVSGTGTLHRLPVGTVGA